MTIRDSAGAVPGDDDAYLRFRDAMATDFLLGRVPPGRDGIVRHALANAGLGATQARAFVDRLLADLQRRVNRRLKVG